MDPAAYSMRAVPIIELGLRVHTPVEHGCGVERRVRRLMAVERVMDDVNLLLPSCDGARQQLGPIPLPFRHVSVKQYCR